MVGRAAPCESIICDDASLFLVKTILSIRKARGKDSLRNRLHVEAIVSVIYNNTVLYCEIVKHIGKL